ncbi:ribbon-helix-helix protein, CopG family [Tsukamurella sp. NPDC003166]|uniref:ribbon-helix-helix protein, CopG family n=1 Tax=Tsukamurella sp. NPDC003166 TaxID=3154444 RepID=UPI0033B39249
MSTRRTTQDEYAAIIEEDARGELRPVPGTAEVSEDYLEVKRGRPAAGTKREELVTRTFKVSKKMDDDIAVKSKYLGKDKSYVIRAAVSEYLDRHKH